MALNIKITPGLGLRPGGIGRTSMMSNLSRPKNSSEIPRAQNFSISKLNQQKEREGAKVSINRVMGLRTTGGRATSDARVGVSEHRGQSDLVADKRTEELEIIRNKAIERQKFVTTRRLVKERMAREAEEAKKAAADKISRQKSRIF